MSYLVLMGASEVPGNGRFWAVGELRELRWGSWGVLPHCCPTQVGPRPQGGSAGCKLVDEFPHEFDRLLDVFDGEALLDGQGAVLLWPRRLDG